MSDTEFSSARDAARATPAPTSPETAVMVYHEAGVPVPADETLSAQEAGDLLTAYRSSESDSRSRSISADFSAALDRMRQTGVQIAEDPNAPALPVPAEPFQMQPAAAEPVDALDAALAHPEVRAAIEGQLDETLAARNAYSRGLATAQQWAQQSLLIVAPELANVPVDRVPEALGVLAQVAPARYNQVAALLDQIGRLQDGQQVQHSYELQQRETWRQKEDLKFQRMVGGHVSAEVGAEMLSYSEELGIGRDALVHLLRTEPVLMSAPFQKVIHDAVTARLAQKRAANWRNKAKPVPTVMKPGVSSGTSSSSRNSEQLNALSNRLSKSGSLRDAAALLAASRKSRS
jgi:hypothetical protein